jgi:hypothetical protein
MKKVLAILMAIVMIASMSTVTFAADSGSANAESASALGASSVPVYGTYQIGDRTDMYKVEVVWGSMNFIYTEAAEAWNPSTHMWETSEIGVWAPENVGDNRVDLYNHSSKPVVIDLTFEDDVVGDGDLTGTWSIDSIALDACSELGDAPSDFATLSLSGKYTNKGAERIKIGLVTATIN